MKGTVQDFGLSANNAQKAKVGGVWYFISKKCDSSNMQKGMEIEFETHPFKMGDKEFQSLDSWKPATTSQEAPRAPAANGNGAHAPSHNELPMAFISNVVAHAIQAGLIKEPKDVGPWVRASRAAVALAASTDPEFDDEVPY